MLSLLRRRFLCAHLFTVLDVCKDDAENIERGDDDQARNVRRVQNLGQDVGDRAAALIERGDLGALRKQTRVGSLCKSGRQRNGLVCDPDGNIHNDGTGNKGAEQVAFMDAHRDSDKETNGSEVSERKNAVARNDHRDQDGKRNKQQTGGNHLGVAQKDGRVKADIEFGTRKLFFHLCFGHFGNRHQAVHNALDHFRHQDHDGGHLNSELQGAADIVSGQPADQAAEDCADDHGFADNAEFFLDYVGRNVDLIYTGYPVESPFDRNRERSHERGIAVRNADAVQFEIIFDDGSKPIAEFKRQKTVDTDAENAEHIVPGRKVHKCPGKRKMPDVPDIHVDHMRQLQQQHGDVQQNRDRNRGKGNTGSPCQRRHARPADIDDLQGHPKPLGHRLGGGAQIIVHKGNNETDADKADAQNNTGSDGLSDLNAENQPDDRDDDRQHCGSPQIDKPLNRCV